MRKISWEKIVLLVLSYALVAVAAVSATRLVIGMTDRPDKLDELYRLIDERFIGEVTEEALLDGAAAGMVAATGDKWSYYIPASQYGAHLDDLKNEYVGIGVTVSREKDNRGFKILKVDPKGGAYEAGIREGDVIHTVEGEIALQVGMDRVSELIRGDENTQVEMVLYRDDEGLTLNVTRKRFVLDVATGQMLPDNIGLITIKNFDERCAEETINQIDALRQQGATALIFDVRYNPGGYKTELVKVLDYILPECEVFRSVSYNGEESVSYSDAAGIDIPMAVLINKNSYSAAEFFAAALQEYDRAVVVGEATTGKGYFQNTIELSDGSAVGLSVGKYYTPKGVSLADAGGLKPDVEQKLDSTKDNELYAGVLDPQTDDQVQAAVAALKKG